MIIEIQWKDKIRQFFDTDYAMFRDVDPFLILSDKTDEEKPYQHFTPKSFDKINAVLLQNREIWRARDEEEQK